MQMFVKIPGCHYRN